MSLLSVSIRVPLSIRCEAPGSTGGVGTPEDESHKVAVRLNFMRQNARDSFRRSWVYPKYNQVSRLQVSSGHGDHPIRSVPVQVAHELINAGHRCLDVRTVEEYNAGHVEGALNIPYLVKCGPGMSKNHKFLEEVAAEFGKDDEIIVGCQSGRRSMMAASELLAANFSGITDMGGGYLAWKESGLPTVNAKQASSQSA